MTPSDPNPSAQEEAQRFERLLLDSARADGLPEGVAQAWQRFSAGLVSAGGLVGQEAGASSARGGAGRLPGSALSTATGMARAVAVKWLLIGALLGSALTALGMSRGRAAPVTAAVQLPHSASPSRALAVPSAALLSNPAAAAPSPSAPNARTAGAPAQRAALRPQRELRSSRSTLGAQVALLDAARAAARTGQASQALALTNRYQRQFPAGELAPDAEVVAIEALAAEGDRATLAGRIARFLARYPSDPHAARVRALAP